MGARDGEVYCFSGGTCTWARVILEGSVGTLVKSSMNVPYTLKFICLLDLYASCYKGINL